MKTKFIKIFSIFVFGLLFFNVIEAQSPYGISYQAVATDENGDILGNQDIYLRISILKDSPTGSEEWIEKHETQTDEFGLFVVIVGEGTPDGGAQSSFSDVNFGVGTYYIKCEIKFSSSSSYELVAIEPIKSVPYSLHANTASTALDDLDKDPLNEIQTISFDGESQELSILNPDGDIVNSVNLTNQGPLNAIGASIEFPQGMSGQYVIAPNNYAVPTGKTFYITSSPIEMKLVGYSVNDGFTSTKPGLPVFKSGTSIIDCGCTGFLVDEDPMVEAVILSFDGSSSYTVPEGAILFIKSGFDELGVTRIEVNGTSEIEVGVGAQWRTFELPAFPGGTNVKAAGTNSDKKIMTGFLVYGISE